MYDAGFPSEIAGLQRARGELEVRLTERGGATVLDILYQAGCLKARFPRGAVARLVGCRDAEHIRRDRGRRPADRRLRDRGGSARDNRLAGGRALLPRPEGGGPAQVRTRVSVGEDAMAEWLPQETILFDGSAMIAASISTCRNHAWFIGVEMLVFGRAAMGERVRAGQVRDAIRVRRAGRPIWHDAVRLDGDIDALLRRPAIANGAGAVATLVHVAPDCERLVDAVRAALDGVPAESGVSAWNGMLVARLLASGAAPLRQAVIAALGTLRQGRTLPRVWLC